MFKPSCLQPIVNTTIAREDKVIILCEGSIVYTKAGSVGDAYAKHELLKPNVTRTKEHTRKDI
jgi:hypothetical protein